MLEPFSKRGNTKMYIRNNAVSVGAVALAVAVMLLPGTASAVTCATLTTGVTGLSDCLQVTFDTTTDERILIDHPGESVTEDIGISIPRTNAFDAFNNNVAYLLE